MSTDDDSGWVVDMARQFPLLSTPVVKWEEWQGQRVAFLCHTLKLSARTFADGTVADPTCLGIKATVRFFPMADISRSLFKYRAAF